MFTTSNVQVKLALKPSIWKQKVFPFPSVQNPFRDCNEIQFKPSITIPKFTLRCSILSQHNSMATANVASIPRKKDTFFTKVVNFIVLVLLGLSLSLAMCGCLNRAMAASGGRMGGRLRSSRRISTGGASRCKIVSLRNTCTQERALQPEETNVDMPPWFDVVYGLFWFGIVLAVYLEHVYRLKGSVLMLQVACTGQIRNDLTLIGERADTSRLDGLIFVLKETIYSLRRNFESCHSAYSSVKVADIGPAGRYFTEISNWVRDKIDEETYVNVGNTKRHIKPTQPLNRFGSEYTVVTILVIAREAHKLPTIQCSEDFEKALHYICSIRRSLIDGVEVIWTPQLENDTLPIEKLESDYPDLKLLSGQETQIGVAEHNCDQLFN